MTTNNQLYLFSEYDNKTIQDVYLEGKCSKSLVNACVKAEMIYLSELRNIVEGPRNQSNTGLDKLLRTKGVGRKRLVELWKVFNLEF
jgi:hypothetical protein